MRFLIVASVLACAVASPSGLVVPYHSVGIAPALPTISAGDISGAAIEAHVAASDAHVKASDAQVEASDHVRAAYDASRQVNDKVNELHGQAVNNAEESAWRAVDNVKTIEARLDGAAAGAAPVLSKQLVGRVAPVVSYAAPAVAAYAAPAVASYAAPAVAAPVIAAPYAAAPYAAPFAAPYAAPFAAPYTASFAAPYAAYSTYPANVVAPYYASPLGY